MKYKTLIQSQNDLSRPPHRGAWIEIALPIVGSYLHSVAPRTGGRGLKSEQHICDNKRNTSPPAQGGVD